MGDTQFFQDTNVPVIAIDGPAGAGKGVICSYLAEYLGFHLLDSGAIYRAVALGILQHGVTDPTDEFATGVAIDVVNNLTFAPNGKAFVNGHCLGDQIRSEEISRFTPKIARIPSLRLAVLQFQLSMRKGKGLVADGRDMCELFISPNCYRLYITARPEVRATRRMSDKRANPHGKLVYEDVLLAIKTRDDEDQKRDNGKLQIHEEAIILNTSNIGVKEVCRAALAIYIDLEMQAV